MLAYSEQEQKPVLLPIPKGPASRYCFPLVFDQVSKPSLQSWRVLLNSTKPGAVARQRASSLPTWNTWPLGTSV